MSEAVLYDPGRVFALMIKNHELADADSEDPLPPELSLKITLDGRPCAKSPWLQMSLVGININPGDVQSPDGVYPIAVARCEEAHSVIKPLVKPACDWMHGLKRDGITFQGTSAVHSLNL